MRPDGSGDRAVSPVVGYVLTLGITALLVSGLIIATGGFVDDQRERTTRSELRVLGQQVSSDIAAVDRLNRTGGAEEVVLERDLPDQVVSSEYTIRIEDGTGGPTDPYIELSTAQPAVTVQVGIASETDIVTSALGGGEIEVRYRKSSDDIRVDNA